MNLNQLHNQIFNKLMAIIDKITFSSHNRFFEFKDQKLYPSEIHLILYISQEAEHAKNATRIAQAMGITKGAVSQNLSRLDRKGIITKETNTANKNELIISFTTKGKQVLSFCQKLEEQFKQAHAHLLSDFATEHKKTLLKFLERLEDIL